MFIRSAAVVCSNAFSSSWARMINAALEKSNLVGAAAKRTRWGGPLLPGSCRARRRRSFAYPNEWLISRRGAARSVSGMATALEPPRRVHQIELPQTELRPKRGTISKVRTKDGVKGYCLGDAMELLHSSGGPNSLMSKAFTVEGPV